jgi:hypothetical protein
MNVRLGQTIYLDFVTNTVAGAESDADLTPTCEVFEETNDTAILSPTPVKRAGKTGQYRVPVAVTAANGFDAGKSYAVTFRAVVGGTAGRDVRTLIVESMSGVYAAVVADGSNTASTFKTDLAAATTDFYKDCLVAFQTGALAGQVKKISGYNGTTKFVTVSAAFTGTPAAADICKVVNE